MKECGLLKMLLKMVSNKNVPLANEAIKMLSSLLCDSNQDVQNTLLDLMKQNRDTFNFFEFIKERLHTACDYLI
jgi:hypothetical protein